MIQKKAADFIRKNRLIAKGDKVIVGLSGGADSVCLFRILLALQEELGFSMKAVHIHHGIRGDEADRDMMFVSELCKVRDVDCSIYRVDVPKLAKDEKISLEEAGRKARYRIFFDELKRGCGNKIAVAHHADDNAETFLMQLFRGSGIKGLCGMRPENGNVIRPLLSLRREEIEAYLNDICQPYCTDSTNAMKEYTRNRIRSEILPAAGVVNRQAVGNINRAAMQLSEIEAYLSAQTETAYERLKMKMLSDSSGCSIPADVFLKEHAVIRKRLIRRVLEESGGSLRDVTGEHVERVVALFDKEVGKQVSLPYQMEAKRTYEGILIRKQAKREQSKFCEPVIPGENRVPGGGSFFAEVGSPEEFFQQNEGINFAKLEKDDYTKWFDYDKIADKFVLRNRQTGDFLLINESGGRKKLKDYFIDEKVPREMRDRLPVFAAGSQILWIPGMRRGEGARISETTEHILKIQWKAEEKDEGTD